MAALATVLVSPKVLRWSRNRMTVVTAVLFVLALTFATTNGWWYVSSYGVPFNNTMPRIAGISVSAMFFGLFVLSALYTVWLHFTSRRHGEGRITRALTAAPIPVAAGFMVLVFLASMTAGMVRQYPTYSNGLANMRAFAGGCGLADDVLVEPDANAGFLTPLPGDYGPLGAARRHQAGRLHPQRGAGKDCGRGDSGQQSRRRGSTTTGKGRSSSPSPASTVRRVPLPYRLDPARVPMAGSYVDTGQQESLLTSAWYQLPPNDDGHPLVVVTAAGTIAGNSVLNALTDGQTVELEYGRPGPDGARWQPGGSSPTTWGRRRHGAICAYPRSEIPADATAVRIVAEDRSLSLGDWVAVTPPRVPELRTVQEYVGSTQPVLMDWAVGLAFPCQQPMLHSNGVTQVPKFRITPDYTAKKQDTDTWEDGRNGGLAGHQRPAAAGARHGHLPVATTGAGTGARCASSTPSSMPSPAELELGTATRSGLWKPGEIRIKA